MNFYGLYKSETTVSLLISGCRCVACAVPEVMDFKYGQPLTKSVEQQIIRMLPVSGVGHLSVHGGDGLEPENLHDLVVLLRKIRKARPDCEIAVWSGYSIEDACATADGRSLLKLIDVLVDHSDGLGNSRVLHLADYPALSASLA